MATGTVEPMTAPPPPPAPVESVERERLIRRQLALTSWHVRLVDLASSIVIWIIGLLFFFLAAAATDHFVGLGTFGRWMFLAGVIGFSLWYLVWHVGPLFVRSINPTYAARTIEEATPSLKNSLINFLLLKQQRSGMKEIVYQAVERQAAADIAAVPVEATVDRTRLIHAGYALCAAMTILAAYKILSPKDPFQTIARVLAPWKEIARPSRVQISEVEPGTSEVYYGQTVRVQATVRGVRDDDKIAVRYTTADGQTVDQPIAMKLAAGNRYECVLPPEASALDATSGAGYSGPSGGLLQNVTYRIVAGDAETFPFRLSVVAAPTIIVDRLDYQYAAYTRKAADSLRQQGDIKALEGTRVTINAIANQPIKSAWIELDPSVAGGAGETVPLAVDGQNARGKITLQLRPDRQTPWRATYQVRFLNERGQRSEQPILHRIEVLRDLAPEVQILKPDSIRVSVPENGEQTIEVRALDPDFGLAKLFLDGTVAGKPPLKLELLEDAANQPPRIEVSYAFRPREHDLKSGDEVKIAAVAEDNRTHALTGQPEPNVTRTKEYTLVVTAPQGDNQGASGQNQPGDNGNKSGTQPKPEDGGQKSKAGPQKSPPVKSDQKPPDQKDKQGNSDKSDGKESQGKAAKDKSAEDKSAKEKPAKDKSAKDKSAKDKSAKDKSAKDKSAKDKSAKGNEGKGDSKQGDEKDKGSEQQQKTERDKAEQGDQGQGAQKSGKQKADQQKDEKQKGDKQQGDKQNDGQQQGGQPQSQKQKSQTGEQEQSGPGSGGQQSGGEGSSQQPGQKGGNAEGNSQGNESGASKQPGQSSGQSKSSSQPGAASKQGSGGNEPQSGDEASDVDPRESTGKAKHDGQAIERVLKEMQKRDQADPQGAQNSQQPGQDSGAGKADGIQQNSPGAPTKTAGQPQGAGSSGAKGQNSANQGTPEGDDQRPDSSGKGGQPQGKAEKTGDRINDQQHGQSPAEHQSGGNKGGQSHGLSKTDKGEKSSDAKSENRDPGAGRNGQEGAGQASNDKTGSGDGNFQNRDQKKETKPDGSQPGENEVSPANSSHKHSDSKGGSSGDNSGGGKQGAGQAGAQEGNDSAGSKSAGDQGAGKANETGSGELGSKAGKQQAATGKTGQAGDQKGDGSGSKSGEGAQQQGSKGNQPPTGGQPGNSPASQNIDPADRGKAGGQQPVGGGNDTGEPSSAKRPETEEQDADAANLEYARKATEMALRRLKDEEHKPDPELLEKLGWTREDLAEFLRRWEALEKSAHETPGGQRELDEAIKSLGLRDPANRRRAGGKLSDDQRNLRDAGNRTAAPPKYREMFDAFRKGAARSAP